MPHTHSAGLLFLPLILPLLGFLSVLFIDRVQEKAIKYVTLIFSLLTFLASLPLWFMFNDGLDGFQFYTNISWIPSIDSGFRIGIDGMSLLLVVLTTFIMPISILASFEPIGKRLKEYYAMMLLLEFGMLGVFVSLDTMLFYVFWELILIPMYFLIGIWGGKDRIYAAVKFFLYTLVGSLLMLIAIVWMGLYAKWTPGGHFTTDFLLLKQLAPSIPIDIQIWLFLAFALSFCIKVPLFPFHTWLPDAHVQAPTAGSVILAGVLLKMGTYGLIRFNLELFPQALHTFAHPIAWLSVIGVIYGALVAMVQTDIKKLVAYSSV
ncbi:MAG: NuoM family protein, partial [Bacteroidota bacterium]